LAHNSKYHKGFLCYGKALDAVDFVFFLFMKEIFFSFSYQNTAVFIFRSVGGVSEG